MYIKSKHEYEYELVVVIVDGYQNTRVRGARVHVPKNKVWKYFAPADFSVHNNQVFIIFSIDLRWTTSI